MKKEQRAKWLALVEQNTTDDCQECLCYYCRYWKMEYYREGPETFCCHTLGPVRMKEEAVLEGADCWGFRPSKEQRAREKKVSRTLDIEAVFGVSP